MCQVRFSRIKRVVAVRNKFPLIDRKYLTQSRPGQSSEIGLKSSEKEMHWSLLPPTVHQVWQYNQVKVGHRQEFSPREAKHWTLLSVVLMSQDTTTSLELPSPL